MDIINESMNVNVDFPDLQRVNVANTQFPVEITNLPDTQLVEGTVQAQQSGEWNVGISGTPNVNVAGTPDINVVSMPDITCNVAPASRAIQEQFKCLKMGLPPRRED